jgi:hypothetical protein
MRNNAAIEGGSNMSYEKPDFFMLRPAAIAIQDVAATESHPGSGGKHSLLYEGCTGHDGWTMIGPTSSASSAYEADE